jgi:hypothetical protein
MSLQVSFPEDVVSELKRSFDTDKAAEAEKILRNLFAEFYNVGSIPQAIRSIVYLSGDDLSKIRSMCIPYLKDDPRDIIMDAEEAAGNPGHWFGIPFHEMKDFSGELPEDKSKEENDNLPF